MGQTDFETIAAKLRGALGSPAELHRVSPLNWCHSPLEVLLATVLTQATNDTNALRAWRNFTARFPEPEMALEVPPEELAEVIRPAGLAAQRAAAIRSILEGVRERFGRFSLDDLADDPAAAWQFLTGLPGVGPKTAACVMLFGMGQPIFPVDTHIHRVAGRLGWAAPSLDPGKMQRLLSEQVPVPLQAELHILLLNLGRRYCRPHQPACASCPLQADCPAAKNFT
ncbi:endonuclease-3 [Hydrogenispora ethanolica]|uniref:Endonuclease-3 n=1 Tax=Hydrogenispora ethanolica TaxID=1082276 RepID=A0A4R1SB71_HYDET|nr:endonuclease III [Hydrogenispora ethanolica]TCL76795.1 endonuclease-3 [Hydrogenispora ethanolica]